jgi:hypothetical protein
MPTGALPPLKVTVKLSIRAVDSIDRANDVFTVTIKYEFRYNDDRLKVRCCSR